MIITDQPTIFPENVIASVSSIGDGSMKFEWGSAEEIVENCESFLERNQSSIDTAVNLFISGKSGWEIIREVGVKERGEGMRNPATRVEADVLITNTPETTLFLPTADCYPVIIYDPNNKVIALLHLGWQSTTKGMAAKTIQYLKDSYGSVAEDLLAYVGPGIKKDSYRFEDPVQQSDPKWYPYIEQHEDGKWSIDLLGFNLDQMRQLGMRDEHVEISPIDTALDQNYYSNYGSSNMGKSGPVGRFATIAMMRK